MKAFCHRESTYDHYNTETDAEKTKAAVDAFGKAFKDAVESAVKEKLKGNPPKKGEGKKLCANVDFYSGFVYDLIGLPIEIYTPLFAMARIVGWCAHRNEELNFEGKRIIRPAYRCVADINEYVPIARR